MCRHLAYVGPPTGLAPLVLDAPHGLLHQSYAPSDMRGGGTVNADWFGAGWYPPHSALRCQEVAARAFTMPAPKKVLLDGPPVHWRTSSAGQTAGHAVGVAVRRICAATAPGLQLGWS